MRYYQPNINRSSSDIAEHPHLTLPPSRVASSEPEHTARAPAVSVEVPHACQFCTKSAQCQCQNSFLKSFFRHAQRQYSSLSQKSLPRSAGTGCAVHLSRPNHPRNIDPFSASNSNRPSELLRLKAPGNSNAPHHPHGISPATHAPVTRTPVRLLLRGSILTDSKPRPTAAKRSDKSFPIGQCKSPLHVTPSQIPSEPFEFDTSLHGSVLVAPAPGRVLHGPPIEHAIAAAPSTHTGDTAPASSSAFQLSVPSLADLSVFSAMPAGSQHALFSKQLQRLQVEHDQHKASQLHEHRVQEDALRSELAQLHTAEFGRLHTHLDDFDISKARPQSSAIPPSHVLNATCVTDLLLQSAPTVPFGNFDTAAEATPPQRYRRFRIEI